MTRKKPTDDSRQTTTTRVYVDTLRILRALSDVRGLTLADYIDELARLAAARDGAALMVEFSRYMDTPPAAAEGEDRKRKGK